MNDLEIYIPGSSIRDAIPMDKPLTERLLFAMRYVREHKDDLFWMVVKADDDLMMRAAIAAVLMAGNEQDKDIITRSLKPLKALAAMLSGVPVDIERVLAEAGGNIIPLAKLWHESEQA